MTTDSARRAYVEALLSRLRRQYAERALLPRSDGRHVPPCEELKTGMCVCDHQDGARLSLWMLKRMIGCVVSEGYGA